MATTAEKLDFWESVPEKDIDDLFYKYRNAKNQEEIKNLTDDEIPVSPLRMPKSIYNKHFKKGLDDPEFTFWFLKYHAGKLFDEHPEAVLFDEHPKKHVHVDELSTGQITAELKKIEEFEKKAEKRRTDINLYSDRCIMPESGKYADYRIKEYLRIKDDYYKTRAMPGVHAVANVTVFLYARHIICKAYLEDKIKQANPNAEIRELNHRQTAIIERLKIDNDEMPDYDFSKGWKQFRKNRETAIRSMLRTGKNAYYKEPTAEEIKSILPYLEDSPKALKAAKEYLLKPQ